MGKRSGSASPWSRSALCVSCGLGYRYQWSVWQLCDTLTWRSGPWGRYVVSGKVFECKVISHSTTCWMILYSPLAMMGTFRMRPGRCGGRCRGRCGGGAGVQGLHDRLVARVILVHCTHMNQSVLESLRSPGQGFSCKSISHSMTAWIALYSPFGMLEALNIHPQKCGGSQKGGEEGGKEEWETKSYTADQGCVWAMGRAAGIGETYDICVIHTPEGVGPGVVMQSWVRLLHDKRSAAW